MGRLGVIENRNHSTTLQKLWDHHLEVVRLAACGVRPAKIAEIVGMTPQQIANILNSPIARERIEALQAAGDVAAVEASSIILKTQIEAAELLLDVMRDDGIPKLGRAKVAQDWLDRGGNGAIKKMDITSRKGLDSETLKAIKEQATKAREAMQAADADFQVVEPKALPEATE